MKKTAIALLLVIAFASPSFAVTAESGDEYKDLEQLRTKIVRMKREMDKLVKDIVATYPEQGLGTSGTFGADVKVDVAETDKNIIVRADLPGMSKDKIEITLENNKILKISGTRETVKKETAPGMVRQERSLGRFERILELPAEGMNEGITASYRDGVLEIVIPRKKTLKEDKVKIKVN
ncbi:MAG: Hsp20/alpha crystallin family protein [Candidatus Omnitrophota bacterium]|jgi:HSP20 family protein